MGLNISIVPKIRDYDYSIPYRVSRKFCTFICGPEAFGNCEFNQIQKILNIDLNIFKRMPTNLEPDVDELDYHLYLAQENKDTAKIKEIEEEIGRVIKEWEHNYDIINDGWTIATELEVVVLDFIDKINNNEDYHQKLSFNFDWEIIFS